MAVFENFGGPATNSYRQPTTSARLSLICSCSRLAKVKMGVKRGEGRGRRGKKKRRKTSLSIFLDGHFEHLKNFRKKMDGNCVLSAANNEIERKFET